MRKLFLGLFALLFVCSFVGAYAPSDASAVPDGYGVPWDVWTTPAMQFFMTSYESGTATVNVAQDGRYVYERGYFSIDGGAWQSFTFPGATNGWIKDSASKTLTLGAASEAYVITFSCKKVNDAWQCGCRDQNSCNKWNIQDVSFAALPPVPVPGCGDGVKSSSEACDDGVNNGPCPKACSATCTVNTCTGTNPTSPPETGECRVEFVGRFHEIGSAKCTGELANTGEHGCKALCVECCSYPGEVYQGPAGSSCGQDGVVDMAYFNQLAHGTIVGETLLTKAQFGTHGDAGVQYEFDISNPEHPVLNYYTVPLHLPDYSGPFSNLFEGDDLVLSTNGNTAGVWVHDTSRKPMAKCAGSFFGGLRGRSALVLTNNGDRYAFFALGTSVTYKRVNDGEWGDVKGMVFFDVVGESLPSGEAKSFYSCMSKNPGFITGGPSGNIGLNGKSLTSFKQNGKAYLVVGATASSSFAGNLAVLDVSAFPTKTTLFEKALNTHAVAAHGGNVYAVVSDASRTNYALQAYDLQGNLLVEHPFTLVAGQLVDGGLVVDERFAYISLSQGFKALDLTTGQDIVPAALREQMKTGMFMQSELHRTTANGATYLISIPRLNTYKVVCS